MNFRDYKSVHLKAREMEIADEKIKRLRKIRVRKVPSKEAEQALHKAKIKQNRGTTMSREIWSKTKHGNHSGSDYCTYDKER